MKHFANGWRRLAGACRGLLRRALRIYRNVPIRIKFLAVLNTILIVPLVVIGYVSYKSSEQVIRNNSIRYSQDILKMIELRLSDNILNLNMISQNAMIDERIYDPIDAAASGRTPSYEEAQDMGAYLRNIILNVNEIQSVCIVSNGGDYISADNNKTKISIKSIVPPASDVLDDIRRQAETGGGAPVWVIQPQNKASAHILYARTLYDRDTYKEIGLMVILLNSDYFNSVFQNVESGNMQNIAVLSGSGSASQVILSRDASPKAQLPADDLRRVADNGWFIDGRRQVLVTYTQMSSPAWKVLSYVSLGSLYRDIRDLRNKILFSCLITILAISLVGSLMSYDFISAINKLVTGMKKVQQGEENVSINLDRRDEIGYMGETFNNMVSEISMLEKWVYREQLTRKEAEIKSLQSQINPHFLFNTLESINWMAQLENAPDISETVTALATLMEANISRDDKFIPLRQELDYIDNYMLILKKRFEDRLELIERIDEGSLDIEIPRLLIQPVVENAVYHGVGNTRGKGVIRLVTHTQGGELTVTVEDNGAGIEPERLIELNRRMQVDDQTYFENLANRHGGGIGLENVNRRIRLFYGSEYGIRIESVLGEYTRVILSIPVAAA